GFTDACTFMRTLHQPLPTRLWSYPAVWSAGIYFTLCPSAMPAVRNATMPLYSWTHVQHAPSRALVLRRLVASGDAASRGQSRAMRFGIFASPVTAAPQHPGISALRLAP